jgi:hypothetical protein
MTKIKLVVESPTSATRQQPYTEGHQEVAVANYAATSVVALPSEPWGERAKRAERRAS